MNDMEDEITEVIEYGTFIRAGAVSAMIDDIARVRNIKSVVIDMVADTMKRNPSDVGSVHDSQGRAYNRSLGYEGWDNRPVCTVGVLDEYGIDVRYDVYHYMVNFLEITDASERLNDVLQGIVNENEYTTDGDDPCSIAHPVSWRDNICDFLKEVGAYGHFQGSSLHERDGFNLLSLILDYDTFEVDGEDYVVVQVNHRDEPGWRSGANPVVFKPMHDTSMDYPLLMVYADCECGTYESSDGGMHYYLDGDYKTSPYWIRDSDNGVVTCARCGKVVEFSVVESV